MKHTLLSFLFSITILGSGCDRLNSASDATKERARAEGEANAEVQLRTQAAKAQKMEAELKDWHFYFQAIAGIYEGNWKTSDYEEMSARISLIPSLPPYTGERVRELSEIEADKKIFSYIFKWNCYLRNTRSLTAVGLATFFPILRGDLFL